jgi:hypothetical protein
MLKALLPHGKQLRRILMGPAKGAILPLDLQYELRLFLGVYERELWPVYRSLLGPGMFAFDIGGRDGYSALLIHSITKAPVISFEADAAAAFQMQETFSLNGPSLQSVHSWIGSNGLSLDDAMQRFGRPYFLKIDVEGAEAEVLKSGRNVLATKPNIIVEVHGLSEERECLDILGEFKYDVRIVNQARVFRERRPLAHNRWIAATAPRD